MRANISLAPTLQHDAAFAVFVVAEDEMAQRETSGHTSTAPIRM